jgi:hypothetical protein
VFSVPKRHFVAIKVFGSQYSEPQLELSKLLQDSAHPGKQYIELALDSFTVHGANGEHFCKVLEPVGQNLYAVLETAFEKRCELNEPHAWRQRVLPSDPWRVKVAKRACWQILRGLNVLHGKGIAHRDIQPGNICLGLGFELDSLSENEIQRAVWFDEEEEAEAEAEEDREEEVKGGQDVKPTAEALSQKDSESDESSDDSSDDEWQRNFEETKRVTAEQWKPFNSTQATNSRNRILKNGTKQISSSHAITSRSYDASTSSH